MTIPKPPAGAGTAGRRLWKAVVDQFELAEHELSLLRQAVYVADTCDRLEAIVREEGPIIEGKDGPKTHPAVVEARQQRIALARLVVALRVPIGDQEEASAPGAPRLQRRGIRGVYGIKGLVS